MSTEKKLLKIVHLYANEMNIYGDMGNIITLSRRSEWRGIEVEYHVVGKDTKAPFPNGDIYFMGGGQDDDMYAVFDDLIKNKNEWIKAEVLKNKVFLLICGAFELFGKYFLDAQGRRIEGLNILPIETKAPGDRLEDRCLGNLLYNLSDEINSKVKNFYNGNYPNTAVGFENHGGQVYFINPNIIHPIGNVISGKGNNSVEKIEGAIMKNVFGSFTHGSFLPKNPHIADTIIGLALENKYNEKIILKKLDDEIEWDAHKQISKKILSLRSNF